MPNIKRLIIKRFGGTVNFLIFVLFFFVSYLSVRNFFTESSQNEELIDNQIKKEFKAPEPSKPNFKLNRIKS